MHPSKKLYIDFSFVARKSKNKKFHNNLKGVYGEVCYLAIEHTYSINDYDKDFSTKDTHLV